MPNATQPNLPPEGITTDVEQLFLSEQPRNLWPENQNSNAGALRKVFTHSAQNAVNLLGELSLEGRAATAEGYLGRWEYEVGLPVAPTGKTLAQRRTAVISRLSKGALTRALRAAIVESYIEATLGDPTGFSPDGIPLDGGGISMHTEIAPVSTLYRIYENPQNFSYEVRLLDTVDPDIAGLTRELARITPAHISFTITEASTPLLYSSLITHRQPNAVWRLASTADSSGFGGMTLTAVGGVTAGGVPSIVPVASNTATFFDGVDDYFYTGVGQIQLLTGMRNVTAKMWIKPQTALPSPGNIGSLFIVNTTSPGGYYWLRLENNGSITFYVRGTDGSSAVGVATAPGVISLNTVYQVVGVKRGLVLEIWINNVLVASGTHPLMPDFINLGAGTIAFIGGTGSAGTYFQGVMDEIGVFDRAWTQTDVTEDFNTANGIA